MPPGVRQSEGPLASSETEITMIEKTMRESRSRRLGLLLGLLAAMTVMPLPSHAGHDVPEDDPNYYIPMPPDRARDLLDAGENLQFIDLREPEEFKRERLSGAISIPLKDLQSQFEAKIPHTGRVVLYCSCPPGNNQEGESFRFLRDQGYKNVTVLAGGISEWRKLGYPIETGPQSK